MVLQVHMISKDSIPHCILHWTPVNLLGCTTQGRQLEPTNTPLTWCVLDKPCHFSKLGSLSFPSKCLSRNSDASFHPYVPVSTVWGRKPLDFRSAPLPRCISYFIRGNYRVSNSSLRASILSVVNTDSEIKACNLVVQNSWNHYFAIFKPPAIIAI